MERLGTLGYMAFIKEVTKGTPLTPTHYLPFYEESLSTNANIVKQSPVYGGKFATYDTLRGQRDHQGEITTLAEANSTAQLFDSLLTKLTSITSYTFTVTSANATIGATYTNNGVTFTVSATISGSTTLVATGAGAPAASGTLTKTTGTGDATITFSAAVAGATTHTFGLSKTTNPGSMTVDFNMGSVVKRFWGVQASKYAPTWNENEMQHKLTVSALGSFQGRTIATVSTTTLTLSTLYDPAPNKGLVVGDLVRIFKTSTGATLDTTIATVNVDGITVTLANSAAAFAAGDIINLRPATETFNLLDTFLWSSAEFRFADTAANALTAAQTRLEQGSAFELMHSFEDDAGAKRSGGLDPAALVRTTGDATLSIKQFFDTPEKVQAWNDLVKSALVIRHFSGSTNQYEFRVIFNHITPDTPMANIKAGGINYTTLNYIPSENLVDGQPIGVVVINNLTSLS